MKKTIALLLVFVLCLSMSACGKADEYESAIALMEAGNYEEAIVALTELGDYEDSIQKMEECENILAYQTALDMIASGDYENAYTALVELGDHKDVPELLTHFKEVEITTENWSDYFDVLENPQFTKNDFGEITELVLTYNLALDEDVLQRIYNKSDSNVIFEFNVIIIPRDVQFDKTSGVYTTSDSSYTNLMYEETNTLTWNLSESEETWICSAYLLSRFIAGAELPPMAYSTPDEITALRVDGSIFIYE